MAIGLLILGHAIWGDVPTRAVVGAPLTGKEMAPAAAHRYDRSP
jgi:hypothetical protein